MCIGMPMQVVSMRAQSRCAKAAAKRTRLDLRADRRAPAGTLGARVSRGRAARTMTADGGRADQRGARRARRRARRRGRCRRAFCRSRRPRAACCRDHLQEVRAMTIPMPLAAVPTPHRVPAGRATVHEAWLHRRVTAENFDAFTGDRAARCCSFIEDPVALQRNARPRGDRARARARLRGALRGRRAAARGGAGARVRYGFRRWPAFVMLADGRYVGAVDGLRNWDEYLERSGARCSRRADAPADAGHRGQAAAATARAAAMPESELGGDRMKDFPLPVRMVGAGSQPVEDEELQYLRYAARNEHVPDAAGAGARRRGRVAPTRATCSRSSSSASSAWDPATDAMARALDLARPAVAGAATIIESDAGRRRGRRSRSTARDGFRIQESVFTGRLASVRTRRRRAARPPTGSKPAAMPRDRRSTPRGAAAAPCCRASSVPRRRDELAGAPGRNRQPDRGPRRTVHPAHVINLTLFPMTPEDHEVLEQALPVGPVAIISRGFGNCHITFDRAARRLARPVLQQHEHADPQHARDRRRAGSRARGGRGSRGQPRTARRAGRMDGRIVRRCQAGH